VAPLTSPMVTAGTMPCARVGLEAIPQAGCRSTVSGCLGLRRCPSPHRATTADLGRIGVRLTGAQSFLAAYLPTPPESTVSVGVRRALGAGGMRRVNRPPGPGISTVGCLSATLPRATVRATCRSPRLRDRLAPPSARTGRSRGPGGRYRDHPSPRMPAVRCDQAKYSSTSTVEIRTVCTSLSRKICRCTASPARCVHSCS